MSLTFEWDPDKALRNVSKHGVAFEEAKSIFRDRFSITIPDPGLTIGEERFITMGLSSLNRLLVVAHTEEGDRLRLISARPVTKVERRRYEEEA